ncbi:SpoU_methylase domain-containing protein [Chloropicon roscoffensis]|uniref:SpoU_methylase domain-containing protein n=1 Tax=Chloropicon roscoffensis TaxID=1461544 RepID=A0AAX4PFT0_9CHLO
MKHGAQVAGILLGLLLPWQWRRRRRRRRRHDRSPRQILKPNEVVVVLERCSDPRNYERILKVCLALGVSKVWDVKPIAYKKMSARNPQEEGNVEELERRLDVRRFETPRHFLDECRDLKLAVWATDLSQRAVALSTAMHGWSVACQGPEATKKDAAGIALVFGREVDGVTQTVLDEADERVYFPLHGFSDSLNVSTSVALILDSILAG